jgi:hypothetical protein
MNLNNLTKAELISKFNQLKNEKLEESKTIQTEASSSQNKSNSYYKSFISYLWEILTLINLIK